MKICIKPSIHSFAKNSLVPMKDKYGTFEYYTCENCGLTGKRYDKTDELLIDVIDHPRATKCDVGSDPWLGRSVRVTTCAITVGEYAKMKPGTIHVVVVPPEGYFNGDRGVWVRGTQEPIKLLNGEFELLDAPAVSVTPRRTKPVQVTYKRTR